MARFILPIIIFAYVGAPGWTSIYDGGKFVQDKKVQVSDFSKLGPDLAAHSNVESNWFQMAPLEKPFYVVGEDNKCYWGEIVKETKPQGKRGLIVYYGSPVSSEHCVYQGRFNPKPSGYSITVKSGGSCRPSHADVEGERYDWVVKIEEGITPFSTCFDNVESYGDNIDRKHHKIVKQQEIIAPVREVVRSEPVVFQAVEERQPTSIEKPPVGAPYTLQFSSHLSSEEAQATISSLKSKGVESFELKAEVGGKIRYRVCAGHFATTKMAREYLAKNASLIGPNSAFVQKIP